MVLLGKFVNTGVMIEKEEIALLKTNSILSAIAI